MRKSRFTLPRSPFLAVALGAIAVSAAALAPTASAGLYTVDVCSQIGLGVDVVPTGDPGRENVETRLSCGPGGGSFLRLQMPSQVNAKGRAFFRLQSPEGTRIRQVSAVRDLSGFDAAPNTVWEVAGNDLFGGLLDRATGPSPATGVSYVVDAREFLISLRCTQINCPVGASQPLADLKNVSAILEDLKAPEAVIEAMVPGPVRGIAQIPFRATDEGAGVKEAHLFVDGQPAGSLEATNEGSCVVPYRSVAPCLPVLDTTLPLDTIGLNLANGEHQVKVVVGDAGGLSIETATRTIVVDNSAPMTPGPIPVPNPIPTPNPNTGPGSGQGPGTVASPHLTGLSLSRKSVEAGKRLQLRFAASDAGTLSVAIAPMAGAAARGRAAKPLTTLTRTVASGAGAIPIATRVRGKLLRPGAYRVTVSLRKADGSSSEQATLRFRVLRHR
ncbi:MAG TPA: hypothetical protein VF081_12550 [Solirubrobacterales bacterium]